MTPSDQIFDADVFQRQREAPHPLMESAVHKSTWDILLVGSVENNGPLWSDCLEAKPFGTPRHHIFTYS